MKEMRADTEELSHHEHHKCGHAYLHEKGMLKDIVEATDKLYEMNMPLPKELDPFY